MPAYISSTSLLQKVLLDCQFVNTFDFEMCIVPRWRTLFWQLNFQKSVVQDSLWYLFASASGSFLCAVLSWYHLPCICNSLELEPVILHGICYALAWSLCMLHGICMYLLYLTMFAFHFVWYLSHIGTPTSHLHGTCYILIIQTFMWLSWGFFWLSVRVSFKVSCWGSFKLSFRG